VVYELEFKCDVNYIEAFTFKQLARYVHYEVSITRPPSCSKIQPPLVTPIKSSHSSLKVKVMHLVAPILPSCNYCGNLAHKANECNVPSEDLFCDYCGKEGHQ